LRSKRLKVAVPTECGTDWHGSTENLPKKQTLSSCGAERRVLPRIAAWRTAVRRYFVAAAAFCDFFDFAAAFRLSDVWTPKRFVNRSTRPSVSTSFWRPVKNGWQLLQISRCSSGLVDRVFHVAPHAHRASIS
jgi:hypothetical protein